jgi:16S rRNA (guanine966-N2)-methyltransferase
MRITGGDLTGRRVLVPGRGVRPTADRVREALFAILAGRIAGARFVDLFAGSGSVGLEAWSRGAAAVVWVESRGPVLSVLRRNVAALGAGAAGRVWGCDVFAALRRGAAAGADVVFADPPYAWGGGGRKTCAAWQRLLEALRGADGPAENCLVVAETARDLPPPEAAGWEAAPQRDYGGSALHFYRKEAKS